MKKYDYVRTSTSIPREHYARLEQIADEKKVSISWVVRDAVETYLKKIDESNATKVDDANEDS